MFQIMPRPSFLRESPCNRDTKKDPFSLLISVITAGICTFSSKWKSFEAGVTERAWGKGASSQQGERKVRGEERSMGRRHCKL